MSGDAKPKVLYDAVIIPGGGLEAQTARPPAWVRARLDAALQLDSDTRYYIVLSRGTTHKAPPLDQAGHPVSESAASAQYLLDGGVEDSSRILMDGWSLDTIGNAYFASEMICRPMQLFKCCVITSEFHMPRTRAIFEWIFRLCDSSFYLDYRVVADVGLTKGQSDARVGKERESLNRLQQVTIPDIDSLKKLSEFVFRKHGAYNAERAVSIDAKVGTEKIGLLAESTY